MGALAMSAFLMTFLAGCKRQLYHSASPFMPGYPVRIECSNCHKDIRGKCDHVRGWSDNHFKMKRYAHEVCASCHGEVQCRNCHVDPKTNELIWSEIKQNRWNRKKDLPEAGAR